MKKKYCFSLLLFIAGWTNVSAQLNIKNAYINISKGTSLVIKGDKINRSTGGIISESPTAKVIWFTGNNTKVLQVPFVNNNHDFIPVNFKLRSGGSDDGYLAFATYAGANWKNSDYLPPTVTNVNRNGADNSNKLIDRFWFITTNDYSDKPDISSLELTYAAAEINAAGNSIIESGLKAQRWNNTQQTWSDYAPATTSHGWLHYITVTAISHNETLGWWTIADGAFALPLTLVNFQASNRAVDVALSWKTFAEINTHHFEIQRSADGTVFNSLGSLPATGTGTTYQQYAYTDISPLSGQSYYRLKWTDVNGAIHYSSISTINRMDELQVTAYPNPAIDFVNVQLSQSLLLQKPTLQLFDAGGKLVLGSAAIAPVTRLGLQHIARGNYILRIQAGNTIKNISLIKQ